MSDERTPIERIMDLLHGDLTEHEAARLEATLDTGGRRELADQAKVKEALAELPGPMLSDDERRRLRTAVKAELRIEEETGRDRSAARRRPSWLVRVLPSAAAAATVVAVIAVAVNLVGDGDSRPDPAPTDIESAVAEPAATVVPVTTASSRTLGTAGGAPEGEPMAGEAPPDEAAADHAEAPPAAELAEDSAVERAAAAAAEEAETALAAAEAAIEDTPAELSDQADRVGFELASSRSEEARRIVGELAEMSETAPVPAAELADRAVAAELVCWQRPLESAGEEGVILWMARGLIDGAEGEGYLVLTDSGDQSGTEIVALYVYPDCRELVLP